MKNKILTVILLSASILSACSNKNAEKAAEKAKMDEVIAIHDTVMGKTDLLEKCKMALDTFAVRNKLDTAKVHVAAKLKSNLVMANEAMETWMHQFNVDLSAKTHADAMNYLESQKKQIHRIDSVITADIKSTTKMLKAQ